MPLLQQGLYTPAKEHDACGLGFVAHIRGIRSHDIVQQGVTLLDNLAHRGAEGCDPCTGDGAGMLLQIPHALFTHECEKIGINLPQAGSYGVGMIFLPAQPEERRGCELLLERTVIEKGLFVLGWRDVPVDVGVLGEVARSCMPVVRQVFITRGAMIAGGRVSNVKAFERELYVVRRQIEKSIGRHSGFSSGFYIASLSSQTIVYKGMLTPQQLSGYYLDLANRNTESALSLVHSRFSTNTFPSWARAHPYRMISHNGEINTLQGNVNWMRVREGCMSSRIFGNDLQDLYPIIGEDQSDSACLDNALEFLVHGGRSPAHAMAMLIPEAWTGNSNMDPDRRAFFEYQATMMEPWDGPAAVAFTDGLQVAATLDRNGLRPVRYLTTTDDRVILSSEAGALSIPAWQIRTKGRLKPGEMLLVDTVAGRIMDDEEIKRSLTAQRPYRRWIAENRISIEELPEPVGIVPAAVSNHASGHATLTEQQQVFGYTTEELTMLLTPMAITGEESVGSMGNDAVLAVLSSEPQLLFAYFKQLFAQVTNPPIDPIRERMVMSLAIHLGPQANLLDERPEHARRINVAGPVLTNTQLEKIRLVNDPHLRTKTLRMLFPAAGSGQALKAAVEELCSQASQAIRDGYTILVLSDRGLDANWAPIPSLLATAAVHHHLIRERSRTEVGLVVETGEAREVMHFATLLGYGAGAVNPYLAFETLNNMVQEGLFPEEIDQPTALSKYIKAIEKGLLKIFSKMGISTAQSYCGAQVFEAIGLSKELIDHYFVGTASRIGGIGADHLARETLQRHSVAFGSAIPISAATRRLDPGSKYHYRNQGEYHGWNPATIATLQHAVSLQSVVRKNDSEAMDGDTRARYSEFSRIVNDEDGQLATLRGILEFADCPKEHTVPVEEVEPALEIVKRFVTGAMSFGSLSKEAHESLALAMNRIGGRSNSGEGGEDPERYGTERNSFVKQIASGRFGVTTEYLVNATELQIKMAQGAKPGEGGQLPGYKVDSVIARTRHSIPGVTLISPPPHHDIYSIEDLAQLIFDLKSVNPKAVVSVKLVSEVGVGTIAAGVAKTKADLILISGDSGGTGASPLSSIKHAGVPWELGLAEAHQTLVLNNLRGRVRLQTDGQLKTGRDVVIAAMLGAEEFGFATAPLIALGCIMMRKCHLNTCPVGIATQDPILREKFKGHPENVINYFFLVAQEAREIMASLGVRKLDGLIGRTDFLQQRDVSWHWKARTIDLSLLLHRPGTPGIDTRCTQTQKDTLTVSALTQHDGGLNGEMLRIAAPSIEQKTPIHAELSIRNTDRAVGALLSGKIAHRYGHAGLSDGTIHFSLNGSAGQSFGAFCVKGVTLVLEGEANDYLGKGLSGGRIAVYPPADALFAAEETVIIGNVALYGATAGEIYINGLAGERFAVRNSGATAVVEGVGDHACEYMTGGVVVVLGKTGRNFAAGMSGGMAFVLNEDDSFERQCNTDMVELEPITASEDEALLHHLIRRHVEMTSSALAERLLSNWNSTLRKFVRVISTEYKSILEQQSHKQQVSNIKFNKESITSGQS